MHSLKSIKSASILNFKSSFQKIPDFNFPEVLYSFPSGRSLQSTICDLKIYEIKIGQKAEDYHTGTINVPYPLHLNKCCKTLEIQ